MHLFYYNTHFISGIVSGLDTRYFVKTQNAVSGLGTRYFVITQLLLVAQSYHIML